MLSDGKQARIAAKEIGGKVADVSVKVESVEDKVEDICDKVQCVNEKVQVVIDGAWGLSSQLLKSSNIYTSRRRASKNRGEGSNADDSTDGQRYRWSQVFVSSDQSFRRLLLALILNYRESTETAPANLAFPRRSVYKSQHCSKGSTQRNGGVALSRQDYHRMEVDRILIVDPRKTCVSVNISCELPLIDSDHRSGLWEKRHLVCCALLHSCYNLFIFG